MRTILPRLAVAVPLAFGAAPVSAGTTWFHEVKFGILAHDMPGIWSGFQRESGIGLNVEAILKPSVDVLGGKLRPAIGATIAMEHGGRVDRTTSIAYAGARWTYEHHRGWFAGIGLGAAIHDGNLAPDDPERKALGSRVLFHIPFELGVRFSGNRSLSIYFDHMSNAGTRRYNEGLDSLGLRYGYRF